LFYQTFTRNKLDQHGPSNPDYLLGDNELLSLFSSLSLVFYQEYARIGDWRYGNRNEACFIGQKF
jgi:tellurite methyltransferase